MNYVKTITHRGVSIVLTLKPFKDSFEVNVFYSINKNDNHRRKTVADSTEFSAAVSSMVSLAVNEIDNSLFDGTPLLLIESAAIEMGFRPV